MKFSTGKINAFYSADQQMRQSIRQDMLEERYADLQQEMENIEELLDISSNEYDDCLFDIVDDLFAIVETLVPELTEDVDSNIEEESPTDPEAVKNAGIQRIKKREKASIAVSKNAEKLKRAKSNIVTARLRVKGAQSPEAKTKAREGLRGARRHLATAGIKAGTTQK